MYISWFHCKHETCTNFNTCEVFSYTRLLVCTRKPSSTLIISLENASWYIIIVHGIRDLNVSLTMCMHSLTLFLTIGWCSWACWTYVSAVCDTRRTQKHNNHSISNFHGLLLCGYFDPPWFRCLMIRGMSIYVRGDGCGHYCRIYTAMHVTCKQHYSPAI